MKNVNKEKGKYNAGHKHSKTYMDFIHLYYSKKSVPSVKGLHLKHINTEVKRFCKTNNLKLIGNDIYFKEV